MQERGAVQQKGIKEGEERLKEEKNMRRNTSDDEEEMLITSMHVRVRERKEVQE